MKIVYVVIRSLKEKSPAASENKLIVFLAQAKNGAKKFFLAVMDSVVLPRVEIGKKLITGSSGRGPNSVECCPKF